MSSLLEVLASLCHGCTSYTCTCTTIVNKSQKACEALLSANPKLASTPNNQGLLPLHSALWEKLDWYSGVSHLVKKYPEANNLLLPGRTAGMYPVMIAAASSGRSCCGDEPPTKKLKTLAASDESDDDRDTSILRLDTIYHLLLHNPAVLGAAIAGKASSEISSG